MTQLLAYQNSIWACEPMRLQQLAYQAASVKCYSAKQVAKARIVERKRASAELVAFNGEVPLLGTGLSIDAATQYPIKAVKGKIGVIPVYGPVDQRMSSALMKTGGTSLEFVSQAFDAMVGHAGIGAIVLHIDSPGGGTFGIQELSDKIYEARAAKMTIAHVDSMAASAGYWLASACSMIVATPGANVGSVGVYAMHVDESKAMEQQGMSVTLVSAGKYKTEYAPTGGMSDEAKAYLQSQVDVSYGKFCAALKRNRATTIDNVRQNYGQGRVLNVDDAMAAGMIDRILPFDQLMSRLVGKQPDGVVRQDSMRQAVAVDLLRMRQAHRTRKLA